ncbi:MAG: monovalent cation/H(+) antiporter subunit G [Oscillospiraceae bacterium]|nr:monovalent cation/H(+) antiporter subunit G [Oscillospiraceae bacterium]
MILRIVIDVLIGLGAIFALAGTIGVQCMPDLYSRMQASTCITTLGVMGVALGGILYEAILMGNAAAAVKIGVILLLVITINPVGAHAIMKGSYRGGFRPDKPMETDDFREDFNE